MLRIKHRRRLARDVGQQVAGHLGPAALAHFVKHGLGWRLATEMGRLLAPCGVDGGLGQEGLEHQAAGGVVYGQEDRKSTRLNSSHLVISYAVFCLEKKKRAR